MAPCDLVDWLTYRGDITDDDADVVRPLARLRDDAAHGGLDRTVSRDAVESFLKVVDAMLAEARPAEADRA